jgi:biopolymer transport protein ExbB
MQTGLIAALTVSILAIACFRSIDSRSAELPAANLNQSDALLVAQIGPAPFGVLLADEFLVGLIQTDIIDPVDDESNEPPTILRMVFGGNILGLFIVVLILLLSVVSLYFIIENLLLINRRRLMPDAVLAELEAMIVHGEINRAIDLCHQKENYSMSTEVVLAGLQRYKSSEYGYAEYRSAVEEAGEDQTGKLYRRTEILNVVGAIAPMLGLTGTVLGMIEAFTTIASLEGMARPQELAGGIGQALITTLLGLLVAIPTMVAFSYFRNKIDSLVSEAGKRIEQVMMPLGRKK